MADEPMTFKYNIIGDKIQLKPLLDKLVKEINDDIIKKQEELAKKPKKVLGQEIPTSMFTAFPDYTEIENGYCFTTKIPIKTGRIANMLFWGTKRRLKTELEKYFKEENANVKIE